MLNYNTCSSQLQHFILYHILHACDMLQVTVTWFEACAGSEDVQERVAKCKFVCVCVGAQG